MNAQARVSDLRRQLEHLFPGKLLRPNERLHSNNLQTGVSEIDKGLSRGIARKHITEWVGGMSSGKTSLLRMAVANWCAAGLNVAYVDVEGQLLAADWAFIDKTEAAGKFWIVRPVGREVTAVDQKVVPLISKRHIHVQEALWSADQFIRSNAFDVVVLDFGSLDPGSNKMRGMSYTSVPSRIYARLQRSLDKSKTALIIASDTGDSNKTEQWSCWARFNFQWSANVTCEAGLAGAIIIAPSISCQISKDGISQTVEVKLGGTIQNRLFAHPQVPDRRTSKR